MTTLNKELAIVEFNRLLSNKELSNYVLNRDVWFQELLNGSAVYDGPTDHWANGTGYMDGAGDDVMDLKEVFSFTDKFGRRGLVGPGALVMERYISKEDSASILIGHDFVNEGRGGNASYAMKVLLGFLTL